MQKQYRPQDCALWYSACYFPLVAHVCSYFDNLRSALNIYVFIKLKGFSLLPRASSVSSSSKSTNKHNEGVPLSIASDIKATRFSIASREDQFVSLKSKLSA
ncbi:hypothetical protein WA026_023851 [Henosepilachna vigintioctopunctata]|uniref:Uncharacterized protein n=1 Tax=Henosepilachna vigintioctopunctata TaxID=420089 RepID=A0AAW1U544_9CUCU